MRWWDSEITRQQRITQSSSHEAARVELKIFYSFPLRMIRCLRLKEQTHSQSLLNWLVQKYCPSHKVYILLITKLEDDEDEENETSKSSGEMKVFVFAFVLRLNLRTAWVLLVTCEWITVTGELLGRRLSLSPVSWSEFSGCVLAGDLLHGLWAVPWLHSLRLLIALWVKRLTAAVTLGSMIVVGEMSKKLHLDSV